MSATPLASSLLIPQWCVAMPDVGAWMTTRTGGVSTGMYGGDKQQGGLNLGVHVGDDAAHVARNRALLRANLPAEPAWLTQVHGCEVLDAAYIGIGQEQIAPEADAALTSERNIVCAVMTADCLPVLLADVQGQVVAAAHAGWRGLAGGVLENTLQRMREAGAGTVQAWLGPAIGPTCFEVGEEVRAIFMQRLSHAATCFHELPKQSANVTGGNKYLCDIYGLARLVLAAEGVTLISGGDHCTVSEPQMFYSYRRDGVTGRMAALIWRR